jgi:hypothetical protein
MFFSVKKPIKILDKIYIPCVCYPVTKTIETTIDHLYKQEKVNIYDKEVYFMNGKILVKKPKTEKKKTKLFSKEEVKETSVVADETF